MATRGSVTLGELMGGGSDKEKELSLQDLPRLLGEGMPKLEYHALGRVRLVRALKMRFGQNYRSVPGIAGVIQKFDQETKTELQHHQLKKKWGKRG